MAFRDFRWGWRFGIMNEDLLRPVDGMWGLLCAYIVEDRHGE